jgi:FtsP/CotA-like multicopper oxidase with cupredoxin domain
VAIFQNGTCRWELILFSSSTLGATAASKTDMHFSSTIGVLFAIVHAVVGEELNSSPALAKDDRFHKHDGSFNPDFYLSVTYENHTVACQHRMSVLVNGTSPGPTLRLTPGKTSWVRVCNNMDMYNTTMVRQLWVALHEF